MPSQKAIGGTVGATEPESQYTFVVYDKGTGKIHHIHQVINMPGAEVRGREEMERTALTYVPSHVKRQTTDALAVLSVLPDQMERGKSFRVDHQRHALVDGEAQRFSNGIKGGDRRSKDFSASKEALKKKNAARGRRRDRRAGNVGGPYTGRSEVWHRAECRLPLPR